MDLKVKKFRLRPRLATVGRILKGMMGVKQLPADLESTLSQESEQFVASISPLAFYQTWSGDDVPAEFRDALHAAGLSKWVSVSAMVATIGAEPEEAIAEGLMKGETVRSQLLTAFGEESADLALSFLYKLLADDAEADDCELSDLNVVVSDPLLTQTIALLHAEHEGISIDSASHLSPRFTRVALVAWTPVSKKKRQVIPSKKRSA